MQVSRFHDGSFVLHKVYVNGVKYSVWYDPAGRPKDAEQVLSQSTRSVPASHTHLWEKFASIARPYVLSAV